MNKPLNKPGNPSFSSGPCAKRPGWALSSLEDAALGRSHRSAIGRAKLQEVIERSRRVLGLPDDYRVGIVPASDTGAVEMCLWSLLGPRGVDILSWESFGEGWVRDITRHLKLEDSRVFSAGFGQLPDLSEVDCDRDIVFAWNGTTSGVSVPDDNWIARDRKGLVICDATSAVFAMELPWDKLDVATYSWQKVLGGEAAHGMLILSPRAVERIENYTPPWPLPKLFRLKAGGKLNDSIFRGDTINTPSLLAVEDAIDGLRWAEEIGGLPELIRRSQANLAVLERWEAASDWISFLAATRDIRSSTSVCFRITDPWYVSLPDDRQRASVRQLTALLETERVAYDIDAYREAPPGLRIWAGSTVETGDLEALVPWLDWSFDHVKKGLSLEGASSGQTD